LIQKRRNAEIHGVSEQQIQTIDRQGQRTMSVIEDIVMNLAVLVISGASAVALGHLFLSVVVKDRRSS
jgi:hypothetical protein